MEISGTYKIRPAGRHILTIGRELIQDQYAAVIELVKNAYDADSPNVNIEITTYEKEPHYKVCIEDHGHGMTRETVIKNWMVPSTDDKLKRGKSPSGRTMQGRKGVGRYAAAILGNDLLLETITPEGEKTTIYVEWNQFENAQYLEDVDILIETTLVTDFGGTRLTINSTTDEFPSWGEKELNDLKYELKKLTSPIVKVEANDEFKIRLTLTQSRKDTKESVEEIIEPFPLFDLYDYRIAGKIGENGKGSLTFSTQKLRNTTDEVINFDNEGESGCGELNFDIRVYDREPTAIEALISRGLKGEDGNYVGKLRARQLLNAYNGIGVFRNGFRLRPLGDPEFDWLRLNAQRIQNPSLRIGSNQVIGFVQIQSEEKSGLIEKSARDGLKETYAFSQLKKITKEIIGLLEQRRFDFRQKEGLSRPALKIEREMERLFSYDELKKDINVRLSKDGVAQKTTDKIIEIIEKEEETKNKLAESLRKAVAIYQGQATLGKLITIILHEGRRPLHYFKNQIPNLEYWFSSYTESGDLEALENFLPIAENIGKNAEVFTELFDRLDPFATTDRIEKKVLNLKKIIERSRDVFKEDLKKQDITFSINGDATFTFLAWETDIYAIFTNMIDNSIYWMVAKKCKDKRITVSYETNGDTLQSIDYRDTGPGIDPSSIESQIIFDPEFTTKPKEGKGLGLAIAGECATRNNLELKAFESNTGAYFRLQPKEQG